VKLGKSATETLEILREAFGEHSLNPDNGFWMAIMFQGRSNVSWRWQFRSSSMKIVVEQSMSSQTPLRSVMEFAGLNTKIWTRAALPRSLFPNSWQMIKSEKANEDPSFIKYHNGWRKLDLRLWSRNKATIVTVEEPIITKTQKGAAGLEFNKEHARCFFQCEEIVHHEFVPPNTTVNSEFYCEVLRCLRENVQRKRP
jgi:hypothetical protein